MNPLVPLEADLRKATDRLLAFWTASNDATTPCAITVITDTKAKSNPWLATYQSNLGPMAVLTAHEQVALAKLETLVGDVGDALAACARHLDAHAPGFAANRCEPFVGVRLDRTESQGYQALFVIRPQQWTLEAILRKAKDHGMSMDRFFLAMRAACDSPTAGTGHAWLAWWRGQEHAMTEARAGNAHDALRWMFATCNHHILTTSGSFFIAQKVDDPHDVLRSLQPSMP